VCPGGRTGPASAPRTGLGKQGIGAHPGAWCATAPYVWLLQGDGCDKGGELILVVGVLSDVRVAARILLPWVCSLGTGVGW
jgi:hypothetical protein